MKQPNPHPPRRILIVDDDRDSATSLAMLLRMTGHEAHMAFDGVEAVEQAATVHPEVVLMDLRLPRLNGYEACRRMRDNTRTQNVVILALSGMGEEVAEQCRAAGFDAHLRKPVDYDVLMSRLSTLSGTGTGR